MKFEEFSNKLDNIEITFSPLNLAETDIFSMLMLLLKKINNEIPAKLDSFIEINSKKLISKIRDIDLIKDLERLEKKLIDYEGLEGHLALVRLHLNYMCEKQKISEEQLWENKKVSRSVEDFITSLCVLFYYHQTSLIDILGKEQGNNFYLSSIDNYNFEINAIYQKNRNIDLDEMRESDKKWLKINPYGRIRLYGDVEDGRLIRICMNCEKFDALQKTELVADKQLFYNTICYMHIPLAKVWNENFVLEIPKSLARGDPYCAYVYFDTRIAKEINKPTDSYLDEVWLKHK